MDRQTLSGLLFLSSLASLGCAQGTDSKFSPTPLGPANDRGSDGDRPHTDPFETTGVDPDDDGAGPGFPGEGETGKVSGGETGDPPHEGTSGASDSADASDSAGGEGETGVVSTTGDDDGDYGSTGDYAGSGVPPAAGPCPSLAQLYADCVAEYTYDSEIALCEQSVANAQNVSPACGTAHSEYLACLSTLDCATLLDEAVPFPCLIQNGLAVFHCGG